MTDWSGWNMTDFGEWNMTNWNMTDWPERNVTESPLLHCLHEYYNKTFTPQMIMEIMQQPPPEILKCIMPLSPRVEDCLTRRLMRYFNGTLPAPMSYLIYEAVAHHENGTAPPEIEFCFETHPFLNITVPPRIADCLEKKIATHFEQLPMPMTEMIQYAVFLHMNGTAPPEVEECFDLQPPMPSLPPLPSVPAEPSFPPRPSIPAEPSFSPRPSIPADLTKPSDLPRPSFSSRPSRIPIISVRPQQSPFTPRPPLPSMSQAATPRVALRRSPLPSPWMARSASASPGASVAPPPAYIESRLKIPNADPNTLAQPAKIQELQASLACTLLLPLENIRIRSIGILFGNGTLSLLPFEPAAFQLSSGGQVSCFVTQRNASRLLRARRMQQAGAQTTVDYTIVEPPPEISTLTTAELTSVLASSPVLVDTVASVGGTQIEATEATPTAAAPAPTPAASSSIPVGNIIGYAVGAAGIFCIAVAAVVYKIYKKMTKPKEQSTAVQPAPLPYVMVTTIQHNNPVLVGRGARQFAQADSFRIAIQPSQVNTTGSAV